MLDRPTTLIIFGVAAAVAVLAYAGDSHRRRHPDHPLALLPWHGMMFVAMVALLFMGVHLLTLLGEA